MEPGEEKKFGKGIPISIHIKVKHHQQIVQEIYPHWLCFLWFLKKSPQHTNRGFWTYSEATLAAKVKFGHGQLD